MMDNESTESGSFVGDLWSYWLRNQGDMEERFVSELAADECGCENNNRGSGNDPQAEILKERARAAYLEDQLRQCSMEAGNLAACRQNMVQAQDRLRQLESQLQCETEARKKEEEEKRALAEKAEAIRQCALKKLGAAAEEKKKKDSDLAAREACLANAKKYIEDGRAALEKETANAKAMSEKLKDAEARVSALQKVAEGVKQCEAKAEELCRQRDAAKAKAAEAEKARELAEACKAQAEAALRVLQAESGSAADLKKQVDCLRQELDKKNAVLRECEAAKNWAHSCSDGSKKQLEECQKRANACEIAKSETDALRAKIQCLQEAMLKEQDKVKNADAMAARAAELERCLAEKERQRQMCMDSLSRADEAAKRGGDAAARLAEEQRKLASCEADRIQLCKSAEEKMAELNRKLKEADDKAAAAIKCFQDAEAKRSAMAGQQGEAADLKRRLDAEIARGDAYKRESDSCQKKLKDVSLSQEDKKKIEEAVNCARKLAQALDAERKKVEALEKEKKDLLACKEDESRQHALRLAAIEDEKRALQNKISDLEAKQADAEKCKLKLAGMVNAERDRLKQMDDSLQSGNKDKDALKAEVDKALAAQKCAQDELKAAQKKYEDEMNKLCDEKKKLQDENQKCKDALAKAASDARSLDAAARDRQLALEEKAKMEQCLLEKQKELDEKKKQLEACQKSAGDLEKLKAELERQRQALCDAQEARKRAEAERDATYKEATNKLEQYKQCREAELAKLKAELAKAQAVEEKLKEVCAELDKAKADLEKAKADKERLEAEKKAAEDALKSVGPPKKGGPAGFFSCLVPGPGGASAKPVSEDKNNFSEVEHEQRVSEEYVEDVCNGWSDDGMSDDEEDSILCLSSDEEMDRDSVFCLRSINKAECITLDAISNDSDCSTWYEDFQEYAMQGKLGVEGSAIVSGPRSPQDQNFSLADAQFSETTLLAQPSSEGLLGGEYRSQPGLVTAVIAPIPLSSGTSDLESSMSEDLQDVSVELEEVSNCQDSDSSHRPGALDTFSKWFSGFMIQTNPDETLCTFDDNIDSSVLTFSLPSVAPQEAVEIDNDGSQFDSDHELGVDMEEPLFAVACSSDLFEQDEAPPTPFKITWLPSWFHQLPEFE